MGIMGYLLIGVLVLLVYSFITTLRMSDISVKEALKDFLHPIIFVLIWPLDIVWCLYRLFKYPDEFKKGVEEMQNKYR